MKPGGFVELRHARHELLAADEVDGGEGDDGHGGEARGQTSERGELGVVAVDAPGGHDLQSREHGGVGEEERDDGQQRVLVQEVQHQRLKAHLVGLPVNEEEFADGLEGGQAHVAVVEGLKTLLPLDPHADVALANHPDIVSAVAHAQNANSLRRLLSVLFQLVGDLLFLVLSHPRDDHRLRAAQRAQEQSAQLLVRLSVTPEHGVENEFIHQDGGSDASLFPFREHVGYSLRERAFAGVLHLAMTPSPRRSRRTPWSDEAWVWTGPQRPLLSAR